MRIKQLRISPNVVAGMLGWLVRNNRGVHTLRIGHTIDSPSGATCSSSRKPLPEDLELHSYRWDAELDLMVLVFTSSTFPEVADGDQIPPLVVVVEEVRYDKTVN